MDITYTKHGDYYYPDLALLPQPTGNIGRFGHMRKRYLKEHQPDTFVLMLMENTLTQHLTKTVRGRSSSAMCSFIHLPLMRSSFVFTIGIHAPACFFRRISSPPPMHSTSTAAEAATIHTTVLRCAFC
ncbi:MAG: TnpV protein [Clostridia bacterium]|nr:TnpV protein [Clostridia bacterium]